MDCPDSLDQVRAIFFSSAGRYYTKYIRRLCRSKGFIGPDLAQGPYFAHPWSRGYRGIRDVLSHEVLSPVFLLPHFFIATAIYLMVLLSQRIKCEIL